MTCNPLIHSYRLSEHLVALLFITRLRDQLLQKI